MLSPVMLGMLALIVFFRIFSATRKRYVLYTSYVACSRDHTATGMWYVVFGVPKNLLPSYHTAYDVDGA